MKRRSISQQLASLDAAKRCGLVRAGVAMVAIAVSAFPAHAAEVLFTENFESYTAGSNLIGQGQWGGLTNQGTASQMPIGNAAYLASGQVLDTRAIVQADRIHQAGHPLPAFDAGVVTTFSVRAYARNDSINTGIGIGENPYPGPEIAIIEEFLADYRAAWAYAAGGWFLDLRGIAGMDESNLFYLDAGTDAVVTLSIIVDGVRGEIYGRFDGGAGIIATPARPITAEQIDALDAVAIYTDRSLPQRAGLELDDLRLVAGPGDPISPCGDVNGSGTLSALDSLAVLKAAVGQPVALKCAPPAQPLATGQTSCHDVDGSPLSCAATGQDGELELGVARDFTDNGDGTISDHATGLMWEKHADDGSVHDADNTYTWSEAFDKVSELNQTPFAGHADWRLPNVRELETLRDFDVNGPPIAAAFRQPCEPGVTVLSGSCTAPSFHWTSSTWSGNPAVAWVVVFETGTVDASLKDTSRHVRAVRGGR